MRLFMSNGSTVQFDGFWERDSCAELLRTLSLTLTIALSLGLSPSLGLSLDLTLTRCIELLA